MSKTFRRNKYERDLDNCDTRGKRKSKGIKHGSIEFSLDLHELDCSDVRQPRPAYPRGSETGDGCFRCGVSPSL